MRVKNLLSIFAVCGIICLPFVTAADDTSIFGGGTLDVEPNVLIIFDNSGSMNWSTEQFQGTAYDPGTIYPGTHDARYVYYKERGQINWYTFRNIGANYHVDSNEIGCPDARETLNTKGHWIGNISNRSPYGCSTRDTARRLRTGNYWNYLDSVSAVEKTRLQIAKEVITELVQTTTGVRFGIMIFNYSEGGRLIADIIERDASGIATLVSQINKITADTWTPLAETLAEAGLYFAGKKSWANSSNTVGMLQKSTTYKSPIDLRCQKNYVIIMTDGEPTMDKGSILTRADYINGKAIKDYDGDGREPGGANEIFYPDDGSDYLDDVAKFLYDEDLLSGSIVDSSGVSFDSEDYPKQNVITYTVGFDVDNDLLKRTADANHGQGDYYTTEQGDNLTDIFETIIATILETSVQFVAPVVPVNRTNRTYADNAMYLGLFLPDSSGFWKGNLKKFGLGNNGMLLDRYGHDALDASGSIKEGAKTCWYEVTGPEGITVNAGGAGMILLGQSTRKFYTRSSGSSLLEFNKTNILPTNLGFADDTYTTERDDLVDYVRAEGIYSPSATGSNAKPRSWVLGDILHSEPTVLYDYAASTNVIFVGANDGFLHCFLDNDHSGEGNVNIDLKDDTLTEAWAFAPWDLLPNLQKLPPEKATAHIPGDAVHDYFVDGSPIIFKPKGTPRKSYVVFGLRRGGDKYYCLNVTDYNSPTFAWEIPNNILGPGLETLGQSWCAPRFVTIKTHSGDTTGKEVLLFAGGYDTNQDNSDPGSADSKGRAIFAVEPDATGYTLNTKIKFHSGNYSNLTYSIVDLCSFDSNDDDFEDTIYAGSLGGDLFVFADRDGDGTWQGRRLFSAGNDGGTAGLRKFMKAPGVVRMTQTYDFVYIGSGDRENPRDDTVTDRFYAIKNRWPGTWSDSTDTLTVADLEDVSVDIFNSGTATEEEKTLKEQSLNAKSGWWFNLPNLGEKVVSSPIVFDKAVWFTTFSPSSSTTENTDRCSLPGGVGTARLYAVNYKTGSAIFDLDEDGEIDRSVNIGGGIPSDPVVVVAKEGTYIAVGRQRGVTLEDSRSGNLFNKIYWIQK